MRLTREEFRHSKICFSQFGEDIAVTHFLDEVFLSAPKVYVDAGCFHPIHFSNTLLLRKRGWAGVNIDLSEEKIAKFKGLRPSDYNVVAALSDSSKFSRIQTFDGGLQDRLVGSSDGQPVMTRTLNDVLGESPWANGPIGYLNIDCEGHDLSVLKGIDLSIYRPCIITIEALTQTDECEIDHYLKDVGYSKLSTLKWTLLYARML
jgi:hypothetical protein